MCGVYTVPGEQSVQVVAPMALPVAEPAAHLMHASSRATGAYLPTSQYSHADALSTYWPDPQELHKSRAAALNLPSAHREHSVAYDTFDTLPGSHRKHSPLGNGGMVALL